MQETRTGGAKGAHDREQLKRLITSLSRFFDSADQTAIQARLDGVVAGDMRVGQPLSYGGTYVLDALWKRLKLDETIKKLLTEREYQVDIERLLFAMAANRALDPGSKLSIERWVGTRVAGVQQLYRAMDFLNAHDAGLQKAVFFSVASLLNLEVDLLLFDTTSTYFEVDEIDEEDEEELRRY